jgi:L-lactate dehydrogenase complex protein LldG
MSGRDEVLARIRAALADDGETAHPASTGPGSIQPPGTGPGPAVDSGGASMGAQFRTRGDLELGPLLDLLAERLADYRAIVRRAAPAELAAALGAALADRGARRIVVAPGLDLPALPDGIEAVPDDGIPAHDLDAFDGVVTGAAVAIAETGTIVLDGSPDQGRRAITLVPDYHLCIVHAAQVVELVPEAITRLAAGADRPFTWISGPSATSDIELKRVEGVHGPRTLEVILVGP